jgi:hypothetical protein
MIFNGFFQSSVQVPTLSKEPSKVDNFKSTFKWPTFGGTYILIDFGWETVETVCPPRRFFWFPRVETLG